MTSVPKGARSAPARCDGCSKPFNALRKPRFTGRVVFSAFTANAEGNDTALSRQLYLCGKCRDDAGGRPFDLPALGQVAQQLEDLLLAPQQGALQ